MSESSKGADNTELPSHPSQGSMSDYTEDQHRQMDNAVAKKLKMYCLNWHQSASIPELGSVLYYVVHSDNRMDHKYCDIDRVIKLLENDEALKSKVADAWKTGSYHDLRQLDILQLRVSSSGTLWESQSDMFGKALTSTYYGCAPDAFYEYLTENNAAFNMLGGEKYYARCCSIVQSSGTGKTRLMLELRKKDVCVLYMNIRSPVDTQGYPDRDDIPANILTGPCTSEEAYYARCCIFFAAAFKVLRTSLQNNQPHSEWYDEMCEIGSPARRSFFADLDREYTNVKSKSLSGRKYREIMMQYYRQMVASRSFPQAANNNPTVVIALDEAHVLDDDSEPKFSRTSVLLRTINEYSEHSIDAVWVVLVSTRLKVVRLPPPPPLYSSARVAIKGHLLFPPFTQLGWDQNAPVLGEVQPDEVAKAGHILRYGRPLWVSLKVHSLQHLLSLTEEKLCGAEYFDPVNPNQVFAVLAQRFGLDILFGHRDAVSYVETLVASHLRVRINTTRNQVWSYSTYPSEPLLSCAAASLLLQNTFSTEDTLVSSLSTLERMVNEGVIDIGQIGELVGRLLWLLAKDFFVRSKVNVCFEELLDCQLVSVVDFLEFVFGSKIWADKGAKAREEFEDAYINFSHWVSMGHDIRRGKKDLEQLPIEQWTLCHWERTSAVQCCHNQPLIDKVIPMYFRERGGRAGVSHILISDEAGISSQEANLKDIRRDHFNIAPGYRGLPYIAILADLSVDESDWSATLDPSSEDKDTCLRIYASGLDATTYPFLGGRDKVTEILKNLHKRQSASSSGDRLQDLQDQMRFGASSEPRYMNLKKRKR